MSFQDLTRREQWENLLRRIREQRQYIADLFQEARDWNEAHPSERPIDADPDGELAKCLVYLDQSPADLLLKEPAQ